MFRLPASRLGSMNPQSLQLLSLTSGQNQNPKCCYGSEKCEWPHAVKDYRVHAGLRATRFKQLRKHWYTLKNTRPLAWRQAAARRERKKACFFPRCRQWTCSFGGVLQTKSLNAPRLLNKLSFDDITHSYIKEQIKEKQNKVNAINHKKKSWNQKQVQVNKA